ncbi:predicted protein [Cyanophage PSS2]|uniref:hypothetical protein n=1 Tax=Cyanophage PSS2 TaxID=658401 RepID=UPI0001B03FE5|nr:hypothetical protein PSS2_gp016 [Cyanophage PSS2]ACT65578.1 hypothetical protein [Cyanophage PSS2]ACY75720.1 predicted protein [Cyanophage PSS2]
MTYRIQFTNGTETIGPIYCEQKTVEQALEVTANTYPGYTVASIATFLNYAPCDRRQR